MGRWKLEVEGRWVRRHYRRCFHSIGPNCCRRRHSSEQLRPRSSRAAGSASWLDLEGCRLQLETIHLLRINIRRFREAVAGSSHASRLLSLPTSASCLQTLYFQWYFLRSTGRGTLKRD